VSPDDDINHKIQAALRAKESTRRRMFGPRSCFAARPVGELG
jgi:hypothetical protein